MILRASWFTSTLLTQEITAIVCLFALKKELSSMAAMIGATSFVREVVERDLGLDLCVFGDGGA